MADTTPTSDLDQSRLGMATGSLDEARISHADREVLRRLAERVAELAARPIEAEKRELWFRHNALESTRPVIFCDPEMGWQEVVTPNSLRCGGRLARRWEMSLRKEIFWGAEMGDDYVIEPYFDVAHVYAGPDWGLKEEWIGGEMGSSHAVRWKAPIKSVADLDLLHLPVIEINSQATEHLLSEARTIFDGHLTVRLKTQWWWTLGMTMTYVFLRGLEQMLYDFMTEPELMHRLMGLLRDGTLAMLDYLEQNDLLSPNWDGTYVGSGGLGYSRELPQRDYTGRVRTRDMWGFGESQETVSVSPKMFGEYIFPYQLPLLEQFGLNCYGCCEPLDKRWDVISRIPRLRRVSVSAWANWERMAEQLGDRYIFSVKPAPSELAMDTFDEDRLRADLRNLMRLTRGCRVEVIMKDNHTIRNDPTRLTRWCRIAREEAERV